MWVYLNTNFKNYTTVKSRLNAEKLLKLKSHWQYCSWGIRFQTRTKRLLKEWLYFFEMLQVKTVVWTRTNTNLYVSNIRYNLSTHILLLINNKNSLFEYISYKFIVF